MSIHFHNLIAAAGPGSEDLLQAIDPAVLERARNISPNNPADTPTDPRQDPGQDAEDAVEPAPSGSTAQTSEKILFEDRQAGYAVNVGVGSDQSDTTTIARERENRADLKGNSFASGMRRAMELSPANYEKNIADKIGDFDRDIQDIFQELEKENLQNEIDALAEEIARERELNDRLYDFDEDWDKFRELNVDRLMRDHQGNIIKTEAEKEAFLANAHPGQATGNLMSLEELKDKHEEMQWQRDAIAEMDEYRIQRRMGEDISAEQAPAVLKSFILENYMHRDFEAQGQQQVFDKMGISREEYEAGILEDDPDLQARYDAFRKEWAMDYRQGFEDNWESIWENHMQKSEAELDQAFESAYSLAERQIHATEKGEELDRDESEFDFWDYEASLNYIFGQQSSPLPQSTPADATPAMSTPADATPAMSTPADATQAGQTSQQSTPKPDDESNGGQSFKLTQQGTGRSL